MRRFAAALLLLIAAALPVSAANVFVSTVVVGMSTRPGGTYTFSNVTVPTGVQGLLLLIDLTEQPNPIPALSAALEGSLDGGTTWIDAGAFTRSAGNKPFNAASGVTVETTGASFNGGTFWADTTNVNRRLRGSATIAGTMRFSMTVQPL